MLEFYRRFWNELLNEDLCFQKQHTETKLDGTEQLKTIFNQAHADLTELRNVLTSRDNHLLEKTLGEQIRWQKQFARSYENIP